MNRHGDFIWYELMTPDPEAALAFYGAVVGWTARDTGPDGDYRVLSADGVDVAGVMRLPDGAPAPGGWLAYVGVDDVDAAAASVQTLGGAIHMPAWDVPEVGRMALVADPQGAPFYLMRGSSAETSTAFQPGVRGHVSWNELITDDPAAALAFYGGLFGWRKGEAMPMGELGDYQFLHQGEVRFGALMKRPPTAPNSAWTSYVQTDDVGDAAERVRAAGGRVVHGPSPVPGDERIIMALDPQGVAFALVGR